MCYLKPVKFLILIYCFCYSFFAVTISEQAKAKGFVDIKEVDPTILVSLRYFSNENFVGKRVDGYKRATAIMTKQTAEALQRVQAEVNKDGYSLVIYDAYRPQQAVNNFVRWSNDLDDQPKKLQYYPRVDKSKTFQLGYIAMRSGHSRGSTVDITLMKKDDTLHPVKESKRILLDGFVFAYLDDGTLDMGSSFDLFDEASHYENNLIPAPIKERRAYLKHVMEKNGFRNYSEEWWHFTLINEPYSADQDDSYFDFSIE